MKKIFSPVTIVVLVIVTVLFSRYESGNFNANSIFEFTEDGSNQRVAQLYQNKQSNEFVSVTGEVIKMLADDNEGSRHQRFILRLDSGHSLLISHNIDLAPRIDALRESDRVTLRGEYEWNQKGGVIHWTHHDPRGRQEGGWIEHHGKRYR